MTGARPHRAHGVADDARQSVERALDDLLGAVGEVHGAIVASVDGLPLAHSLRSGDAAGIAAMAATTAGLCKRIVADFAFGDFAESVMRGDSGYFVVYSAGQRAVLAVLASEGANLGRVHLQARRCASAVAEALREQSP